MFRTLKMVLQTVTAVAAFGLTGLSNAQNYPSRPITVIVPFAPGGNLDVITRVVTAQMATTLGQPFIVENVPGAGGLLGLSKAAKSKPDGYTIAITANGGFAYTPKMSNSDAFSPKDFAPVGMVGITPMILEVPANSRFKTFKDLANHAKQNPAAISVGHPGNGTTNHIAVLLLQKALNIQFNVIPYKGSAPALNDLLGQQIDIVVDQIPGSIQHLRAGTLRGLAVTSKNRAADLPDVPTLEEEDVANFEVVTASGFLAPAGVAPEVVKVLNEALNAALAAPKVRDHLASLGTETKPNTAEEFSAFLQGELQKADELAKQGLLQANQ